MNEKTKQEKPVEKVEYYTPAELCFAVVDTKTGKVHTWTPRRRKPKWLLDMEKEWKKQI